MLQLSPQSRIFVAVAPVDGRKGIDGLVGVCRQQLLHNPLDGIVALVDQLLDDHVYAEIADRLNGHGLRPGGAARPGRAEARFTPERVAYLVHRYGLRSRYDRLRERGLLTKPEAAARLGIHEATLIRWVAHGIVTRHAYNAHAYLYEPPGPNPPVKQCSRWNRLTERAAAIKTAKASKSSHPIEEGAV